MSRCYPGALQQNLRRMLSSSEENSTLATRVAQEEMDQIVSPITHGKEIIGKQAMHLHRKRKELDALVNIFTLDTASLNNKRRRETFPPLSSLLPGPGFRGPSHYRKGESSTGETLRKSDFNGSLQSSGLPRSVSPPSPSTEGVKAISRRNALSRVDEATSAQGSGLANQSTVTTSSTEEEEESTSLDSFGQTSKVASDTEDTVILMSCSQAVGIGSIGCRQTGEKRARHALLNQSQRNTRKPRIRDRQRNSEVLSPFSNVFAKLIAHDAEADTVSGSILRDVSYGERSGKTETTCVLNSGCSSIEAGKGERATGYGCSIRQYDDSSELVHSSCSRELYSSSIGPGLSSSSWSESIPSGLLTPYQPYRPMKPSRMKGSVVPLFQENSVTVDEMLATKGLFATDKYKGQNSEVTPESSHAPSHGTYSNASEQGTENSSSSTTECKSSSGDTHPHVDGGPNTAPRFVLSSGRMSKDEAKRRGLRPSTIDDDFDQYFAQLML